MKLFQSIFGLGESRGRYPEALIEEAIGRAVAATDPRLLALPGCRKARREPVIKAIDHVIALVDGLPPFLPAGPREFHGEPRLAALFASARDMLDVFSRSRALTEFLSSTEGAGAAQVTSLLLAERAERHVLGVELVGDALQREVAQVSISFSGQRLLDPKATEAETRRQLKRRAFDHLLALALGQIAEAGAARIDLARQRDLLRRKLDALQHGGWTFEAPEGEAPDMDALRQELDACEEQLKALGPDTGVLNVQRDILIQVLSEADRQLWAEQLTLYLDGMNIQRAADDPSARRVDLPELRNSRGAGLAMLPVAVMPAELPVHEDLVAAAERYLY